MNSFFTTLQTQKMNLLNFKFTALLCLYISILTQNVSAQKISDNEIKKDAIELTNAVKTLKQLEPVSFNYNISRYKDFGFPHGSQYGFLTEDVKAAIPGIVKSENKLIPAGKNNYKNASIDIVDMTSLIPFLVKSIKEQQDEIDKLKSEIKALKHRENIGKIE